MADQHHVVVRPCAARMPSTGRTTRSRQADERLPARARPTASGTANARRTASSKSSIHSLLSRTCSRSPSTTPTSPSVSSSAVASALGSGELNQVARSGSRPDVRSAQMSS